MGYRIDSGHPFVAAERRRRRARRWRVGVAVVGALCAGAPAAFAQGGDAQREKTGASFKLDNPLNKKRIERTKQADKKRDEEIELLKRIIPKASSARKAEMIFRLADLYWEKSRYRYGREFRRFEAAHARWTEAGQRGTEPTIRDYVRGSSAVKKNALRLYQRVLRRYPSYPRNDEVLFNLGNNEYEDGKKKRAVRRFQMLIKRFPNSRLVADSHLLLGEHYFNANQVNKARSAYRRAARAKEARIKYYALYKLAWCDYNLKAFDAGIRKLKRVVDHSQASKDKNDLRLGSEALSDLARFFSFVDEVDAAFAYFQSRGGEARALRHMGQLGALYNEQGKWRLEIATYRLLLKNYPMNDRAPALQANVVEAYARLGDRRRVRRSLDGLVDRYRPGSPWHQHYASRGEEGTATIDAAAELAESKVRGLVTEYHREAQKRKDVKTYLLARDIYSKYLEAFASTDAAYEMRYFYAEVLWALKQWKNAGEQYRLVALRGANADKKSRRKYAREAAYSQILAYEKVLKTGRERGSLKRGTKIVERAKKGQTNARAQARAKVGQLDKRRRHRERPIPDVEMKLSEACDLYFRIAPTKDKELPAIKFKAAYIFYKYNHFVEAAKRYFEIIERWPSNRLSKKAANLVLDSLNVQKKYDELSQYAGKFLANRRLTKGDKAFRTEVQSLLEGATYLSIQQAEQRAGKVDDAAQKTTELASVAARFRRFQEDFPKSKYADEATYSAMVIYDQADELDNAIAMSQRFQKNYPTAKLAVDNDWRLAQFHERIADFERAAALYDRFFETHAKDKRAVDALYNAGVYYQGLGRTQTAIARYLTYLDKYRQRGDAADVYWRVCQLHEGRKAWSPAAKCYDGFRARFKKASPAKVFESRYRYALALTALKQNRGATKEFQRLVRDYRGLKDDDRSKASSMQAVAHAAFELLEPDFRAFMRMKVTLRPQTLRRKLAKAEALACDTKCKTRGRYVSLLAYGSGEYGICALTRIGQIYGNMATSIREAPVPNLTPDQEEIYRTELDNRAMVPEQKGIEALEAALGKAHELGIYNRCTDTAQRDLKAINPDRFPDLQKRAVLGAEGFITAGLRSDTSADAEVTADAGPTGATAVGAGAPQP